jgi:hypothetical protein
LATFFYSVNMLHMQIYTKDNQKHSLHYFTHFWDEWPETGYYIIDYTGNNEFQMMEHTLRAHSFCNKKKKYKNVVLIYPFECMPTWSWVSVISALRELGYARVLLIDGGFDLYNISENLKGGLFVQCPLFFDVYNDFNDGPPVYQDCDEKNIHFVSLARRAKASRVRFTGHLLTKGLDKKGIVTCGWASEDQDRFENDSRYLETIPKKYHSRFPMHLGHDQETQWDMKQYDFHKAVFNVIQETHTGWDPNILTDTCSDRGHFTEKTSKCFAYFQIPLVVGVPYQVARLRELGFDMFDDVIDHSYDTELNIFRREEMVAEQLEKVCKQTVQHWNTFIKTHQNRFLHNSKMLLVNSNVCHKRIKKILQIMEQKA